MNERVTIQAPGVAQDENGEPVAGWTDVATLWAGVVDITGREYVAAGATQASAQTKITIRYTPGIVPAMRVVHGTNVYDVESVLGQYRKQLVLMCTRKV
jgi:SPP1 family predicted phage head-tail adaptor